MNRAAKSFISGLQAAYSGEKAAALAYQGHARSVSDLEERKEIARIEEDEWRHRREIKAMLDAFGAKPKRWREVVFTMIGSAISMFCHIGGWFAPMYGAGRIEARNIVEYEVLARRAHALGRTDLVECFLKMAEVEWDHEAYFRRHCEQKLPRRRRVVIFPAQIFDPILVWLLPMWKHPGSRPTIRSRFEQDHTPPTKDKARVLPQNA